jgi:hypothetical protein
MDRLSSQASQWTNMYLNSSSSTELTFLFESESFVVEVTKSRRRASEGSAGPETWLPVGSQDGDFLHSLALTPPEGLGVLWCFKSNTTISVKDSPCGPAPGRAR